MRLKKLFLFLLSLIFFSIEPDELCVCADDDNPPGFDDDSLVCVDLADFFYEIILGVTSFPEQGDCNEQQEAEIAALLQSSINTELNEIPGTINTQNKVCGNPINNRRLLLPQNNGSFSHENLHQDGMKSSNTTAFITTRSLRALHSPTQQKPDDRSLLLRHGRRSFIYVGGGRCRFCFYDNKDKRFLSPATMSTTTRSTNEITKEKYGRNLLTFSSAKRSYPEVADILLCERFFYRSYRLAPNASELHQASLKWINAKTTRLPGLIRKGNILTGWNIIGPYGPGESFGVQVDTNRFSSLVDEGMNKIRINLGRKPRKKSEKMELPVKDGKISFQFVAFDLPTDLSTGMLADNPLIIFINGIKLDISLLVSQPGVERTTTDKGEELTGNSVAGIRWKITDRKNDYDTNISYGPEPDRVYSFQITAPTIVLAHKNQMDLDFVVKPNARAKKYGIVYLKVQFSLAACEVTDLENTPFEDFKGVVESRLFHRLGMDLSREFQSKQGHCLQDKIPVVNVHLVEKEGPKDSNPQCG